MGRFVQRYLPPDREIILRTGGRVRYVRLPRWAQIACIGVVTGAVGWVALATHLNINHLEIIASRDARIVSTETVRHSVEQQLLQARRSIDLAAVRDEENRLQAARLNELNLGLRAEIKTLEQRITRDSSLLAAGQEERDALTQDVASLEQGLSDLERDRENILGDAARLKSELAQNAKTRMALNDRIAQLLPRIGDLKAQRDTMTETTQQLRVTLAERIDERDRIADERNKAANERDAIAGRISSLTDQLAALETAQEEIISRFDSQTVDSIELAEKTLLITGLDVERLLARLSPSDIGVDATGVGGPFVAALDEASGKPTSELASNIAAVEKRVTRWRGLQVLLQRLPLTVPLDNYHVTSTYGRRMDPLKRRPAMHEGIDFSSERRAEIRATSPGRVSFVGWRGGFGKMVEIDHGLGVRTRYAHLSKIYVKRGLQVDFRDKLGQVGNTGRSTGEHLHYEVLVDGRAQDPANFMKAGQYVFKN